MDDIVSDYMISPIILIEQVSQFKGQAEPGRTIYLSSPRRMVVGWFLVERLRSAGEGTQINLSTLYNI